MDGGDGVMGWGDSCGRNMMNRIRNDHRIHRIRNRISGFGGWVGNMVPCRLGDALQCGRVSDGRARG